MKKVTCKAPEACKSLLQDSGLKCVFCPECTPSVKSVLPVNYFDLYNLQATKCRKTTYEIDKKALANVYKKFQLKMHPDVLRQTYQSSQMPDVDQYSQLLSKSFTTLNDDLFRACYLLDIAGAENPLASEQAGITNSDLMMLMFEVNEAIESGHNKEAIAAKVEEEMQFSKSYLNTLFEKMDFDGIKEELIKYRYYRNLDSKLKGILNVTYD